VALFCFSVKRFVEQVLSAVNELMDDGYECSFAVSIVAFIEIDFTVIFSTSELTGGDAVQRNRRPRLGHLT